MIFKWTGLEGFRSPSEIPESDQMLLVVLKKRDQTIVAPYTTEEYLYIKKERDKFGVVLVAWKYLPNLKKKKEEGLK